MGKARYYGPNVPGSDQQMTRALTDFANWMDHDLKRSGVQRGSQGCLRREVSERKPAGFWITHAQEGKYAPMVHADAFQCPEGDSKDRRIAGLWYKEMWGSGSTRELRLGIICTESSGLLVLKGDYNDKFDTGGRYGASGKGTNEFHWEHPADSTREAVAYLEAMRKLPTHRQDLSSFVQDWADKDFAYPWRGGHM